MITYADIDKLRHTRTGEPAVLSVYLRVPLDPTGQRELRARAGDLIGTARGYVPEEDRNAVAALLAARGCQWLGKTVAIFASGELSLLEALPLRCPLHECAVLAARPYIRPLLTAIQRCPAYHVAIIDSGDGWLMSVDDELSVTSLPLARLDRAQSFGGWYGLDSWRVRRRTIQRVRVRYRAVAQLLADAARAGGPVVIGGHPESIPQLLRLLPDEARARYAGSFAADAHTLTPARARELADKVIADWCRRLEQRLADEVNGKPPGVAVGLQACLAAVNDGAISTLLVPDDGTTPGFMCARCGTLSVTDDQCPDWGTAAIAVPDLLEEMACRVLDDAGQVMTVGIDGFEVAARLRFPLSGSR